MPEVHDIEQRCEEIRALVFGDDIRQALKRLMDFVRDFAEDGELVNEVVVISANHHRLQKLSRQQLINFDDEAQQRSRLLLQALGLMDSVVEAVTSRVA